MELAVHSGLYQLAVWIDHLTQSTVPTDIIDGSGYTVDYQLVGHPSHIWINTPTCGVTVGRFKNGLKWLISLTPGGRIEPL